MVGTDCIDRIRQLRERVDGLTFDLVRPGLFVITVPGRDEPFESKSLCDLATQVETYLAEELTGRMLSGIS